MVLCINIKRYIINAGAFVDQIITELAELNKKADTIIKIMQKPESRFLKIIEVVGNVVAIIGVLAIIEIVRNWFLGG